ncbi:hypothetical protein CCH79_00004843 [Gambusia affinis]|uniref:CUT domain-containing protein n=1 Tax=Gambusia affinis TaxID=33528 RepID=A0A315V6A5_GAMAF|nr:hypothetical protein CCH79_00004843 [Gambusia affinis]
MREDRSLAPMNSLYPAYHHKDPCMGQSLSPLSGSGLASIHTSQAGIPPYAHPGAAMPGEKMLTPSGFEAHHPAMLSRHAEQHMTSSAGMVQINGLHHHPHAHLGAQGHGQGLGSNREQASGPGHQGGGGGGGEGGGGGGGGVSGGQMEEVNTKEVAQRITTELKRYSIPQAIFAQRVLCRSQGTLSDLLRNPKPWSKLKSGRETFRRMWKWLQEPEFQRMSALRLAEGRRERKVLPPTLSIPIHPPRVSDEAREMKKAQVWPLGSKTSSTHSYSDRSAAATSARPELHACLVCVVLSVAIVQ